MDEDLKEYRTMVYLRDEMTCFAELSKQGDNNVSYRDAVYGTNERSKSSGEQFQIRNMFIPV